MKFLGGCLGEIAWQIAFPFLAAGYCIACFVVFDAFHVTDLGAQVLIGISPALALAVWLVRRGKIK